MDQYWVVTVDGREFGPVDLNGLVQWVREGRVLKTTRIRKNTGPAVAAELLPELAEVLSPQPVAGPAMPPMVTSVALPSEFKAWEFIGLAWELVKPHWLPLALMALIVGGMGAIPYVGPCLQLIIGSALMIGFYRAIFAMVAGQEPKVEMLFSGFDRFGQAFLFGLVAGVLYLIGLVMLIVPGIIFLLAVMFGLPILAETDTDFWTAMKMSYNLTNGYKWQLFGLALANFCIILLGVLCCCVGVFVAYPVVFTSTVLAYRFLQGQKAGVALA